MIPGPAALVLPPWRIGLTGTPGVGKTTLAALLRERGVEVVDIKAWAKTAGAVVGHDQKDGADVIDTDRLQTAPTDRPVVYEGHLAQFLDVDALWVVRCDPEVLRARLEARGYPPAKVRENLEAEALDLVLQESIEAMGDEGPVVQRDGTRRRPMSLMQAFVEATNGKRKSHDLEPVDWSHRLPI